ncbi:MAG: sensor histidine kinase [Candidatus Puniceispirillaceae bacterium]
MTIDHKIEKDKMSHDKASKHQLREIDNMHVRGLLHDMNNALMLIILTSEQIQDAVSKPLSRNMPYQVKVTESGQMAEHAGLETCEQDSLIPQHATEILRQNVSHLREMLSELNHYLHGAQNAQNAQKTEAEAPFESKINAGDAPIYWGSDDVNAFLMAQKPQWELIVMPQTQITIDKCHFEGAIQVFALSMARIFQNLIRNACEAFSLVAGQRQGRGQAFDKGLDIRVIPFIDQDKLMISVIDNGGGIPKDLQDDIFTPYVSSKQSASITLSGLGLSSAKEAAHSMGGDLSLHKSSDEWAHFILSLPMISSAIAKKYSQRQKQAKMMRELNSPSQ